MKGVIFDDFVKSSKEEIEEIISFVRYTGLSSIADDTVRVRAIQTNNQKLNEFQQLLSSIWSFSIPFSREERSVIFKLKRNIESYLRQIKILLNQIDESEFHDIVIEIEKRLKTLDFDIQRFFNLLNKILRSYDIPKFITPVFLYSIGGQDQLVDLLLFCLSYTNKCLKIITPFIDKAFTKILDLSIEKKNIDIKILIGSEPNPRTSIELLYLIDKFSHFQLKINYDLHGRCIIMDEKVVFVHNTDFQTYVRLGRIDAGLGIESIELTQKALEFFDKAWNYGVEFSDRKFPVKNLSKSIVIGKANSILSMKIEIKMLLFDSDPYTTYRDFSGRRSGTLFGFIDTELKPIRVYLDINHPSRKYVERIFLYDNTYNLQYEIVALIDYIREENTPEIFIIMKEEYTNEIAKIKDETDIEIRNKPTKLTQLILFLVENEAIVFKEKKFRD